MIITTFYFFMRAIVLIVPTLTSWCMLLDTEMKLKMVFTVFFLR